MLDIANLSYNSCHSPWARAASRSTRIFWREAGDSMAPHWGGWLRDGRQVTQTLTNSIFASWWWYAILWVHVNVLMRLQCEAWPKRAYKIAKILIGQYQFTCIHHQYTGIITTMDCFVWSMKKHRYFGTCYQSLNKAIMYRSVNILSFCL